MNGKRRSLGRGLDALLEPAPPGQAVAAITSLPLDRLAPNPQQPRVAFDDAAIDELARSIREQGMVQPLVVAPRGDGTYLIVAGERRFRAAQRAGLAEVPVVARDGVDDRGMLELALVENLQRADLNPLEEAEAYRRLHEDFGLGHEEIGARVGKSRVAITNVLRLLRLPPEVQDLLRGGHLTAGQVRPLVALEDRARQVALAERARDERLSAREIERLAAEPAGRPPRQRPDPDVHTADAEERLTRALQTKVEIRRRGKGGSLVIHFYSEEELIRLYELLAAGVR